MLTIGLKTIAVVKIIRQIKVKLQETIKPNKALCYSYIHELLCSFRRTHAATLSIEYVTTFCFAKAKDRRRLKPELRVPPDGLSVIFSDDTPTKTQQKVKC